MGKTVSTRGKSKYIPQGKAFAKQGDRAANLLRPEYRWVVVGRYFCDQEGNIYSVCNTAIKVKAQHANTTGYMRFTINGDQKMVAREVLKAWKGEAPPGFQCAHLNDVKTDNNITNLRWARPGNQGDLKRIIEGTASQELYTNGSNRLDAQWNRAMKRQYETIQSHSDDCSCSICELRHLPEAVPLSLRQNNRSA